LGPDPVSGGSIVIKEGRFGPYVTDGDTNASLKAGEGDVVETLSLERAASLLQIRREAGPAKPRRAAKKAAKKTTKAAAKKPAKAAAKKTTKAAGGARKAATKRPPGSAA
jgi:DNA topoisomerase-1